jgi:hypothetical protein
VVDLLNADYGLLNERPDSSKFVTMSGMKRMPRWIDRLLLVFVASAILGAFAICFAIDPDGTTQWMNVFHFVEFLSIAIAFILALVRRSDARRNKRAAQQNASIHTLRESR